MGTELSTLLVASVVYLSILFGVAEATERGYLPSSLSRHPVVFSLSLGVYATSWTYYGSVGLADRHGYIFLTIYTGVTLACLLIPFVWLPLLRVVRRNQLSSLADLFALRYQSQSVGVVVTLFMLGISLPYLALQVRAVANSTTILANLEEPPPVALAFCAFISLFAALFGARHAGGRARHPGLVVAIALESLVKLTALLAVGAFALFGVLGGPTALSAWLSAHPDVLDELYRPVREGPWATLTLLSFSAAFMLPRQFHMAFTEDPNDRAMRAATWMFPLCLLLLNLPVPLVMWAGEALQPGGNADFHVLVVANQHPVLAVIAFLGGLSASSAMIIVCSIALASMTVNHLVLPLWRPKTNIYTRMAWVRRLVVVTIVLATYFFYTALDRAQNLASLGLVSFVGVAQFLPALFGTLVWSRITRRGVLVGVVAGFAVWLFLLVFPLFGIDTIQAWVMTQASTVDAKWQDVWTTTTILSLGTNAFLAIAVSLTRLPRPRETRAAALSSIRTAPWPEHARPQSAQELERRMAKVIGTEAAAEEIRRANRGATVRPDALPSPAELERLTERLEANLSGLVGPLLARAILGRNLDFESSLADQVLFLERRASASRDAHLSREAAQIELVRRYLRRVLEDLPIGVTVTSSRSEVVLWNRAMVQLTGLPPAGCLGFELRSLPAPWSKLLINGGQGDRRVEQNGHYVFIGMGESHLDGPDAAGGRVILVQDRTAQKKLEAQLAHQERLASVGRLAAGVAHEIGNPLTGILVLARNLVAESHPEDLHERLGLIVHEAEKIERIVSTMVNFSRKSPTLNAARGRTRVALHQVIDDAVRLVDITRKDQNVHFNVACPMDIEVVGDAPQLEQVFVNVLANACDASPPGAPINLTAEAQPRQVQVTVKDHGIGMPREVQEQVFEPFFTTKAPGEGTGLGLAIVYGIVTDHRGRLEISSQPGAGTELKIWLERAEAVA